METAIAALGDLGQPLLCFSETEAVEYASSSFDSSLQLRSGATRQISGMPKEVSGQRLSPGVDGMRNQQYVAAKCYRGEIVLDANF